MAQTEREMREIEQANTSTRRPVVFVHGLWLLPCSWQPWRVLFEEAGFVTLAPGWPDDPATVTDARADPAVFAGKKIKQVTDHYADIISQLIRPPVVIGHSFGGLISQQLAGRGLAAVTVAVDAAPFRGVLPLPLSALRGAWPVIGNPLNYRRAVSLTYRQFRFAFANAVSEAEAKQLFDAHTVAASGIPLFQAATANVNPWSQAKVNTHNPARGPLLIISGEKDNIAPRAITRAAYRKQQRNPAVTTFQEIPDRGHSLVLDSGWRDVADAALAFVNENL